MTISSSLNAGVAGLNANAARLSTISDNIANSATYGYKRADADFHSLVISGSQGGTYSAGGVRTTTMRLIDERGPLIATANPTDIAIDGRGFLPVSSIDAVTNPTGGAFPISLTTTGSFRPDDNGVLRTATGQVLMGWPTASDGTMPSYPRDSMAGLVPVRISSNEFVANPTTRMSLGVNLPATATNPLGSGDPYTMAAEYFGNLGTSETVQIIFTPAIDPAGQTNNWTMRIVDGASNSTVGEYALTFDASQAAGGTLASVTTISGGNYDPVTGVIPMTLGSGTVSLDIGLTGGGSRITQLADTFAPTGISRNGSSVATLSNVEIDSQGNLFAIYDQGFTRRIYQIPIVDVPNPNGLTVMSNQTYTISKNSGPFYLWNAGDGPTGSTVGFSREESATDVAAELTQLIQTQRAYSSNAKVIQTVDEMLQETTNIKR